MVRDSTGPAFRPDTTVSRPRERAAITLALSIDADRLLIDEQVGRAEAERRRLLVTGTLGVLADAHRAGLLDFETAFEQLRKTNFYVSAELLDRVRRRRSTGLEGA
jgi:predicted nucleic acid-binding protein